jgi:nucleotide-binding universal stress UspA family protein
MIREIRNIVVGVDLSRSPDPVLHPAAQLAAHLQAELHIVHGYMLSDPLLDAYTKAGYLGQQTLTQYGENIQAALESHVAAAVPGISTKPRALAGSAASAMMDVAAETGADLIIVGSARHHKIPVSLLGSSCRAVVRKADVPVLMMRPDSRPVPRGILVATDLSPLSAAAYGHGLAVAGNSRDVQVRCVLVISDSLMMLPLEQQLLEKVARQELDEFAQKVAVRGEVVEKVVRRGEPAAELAAEAGVWGADLLVLGSHGRRGMERFLIGSVAETVLKTAPCNVLVVPAGAARHATSTPGDDRG